MQTANVNPQVTVTCRHMALTDAIRDYAGKKIEGLHLDYPRIIEARVILDVQNHRQTAEILLFCANHITIDATTRLIGSSPAVAMAMLPSMPDTISSTSAGAR